MKDIIRKAVRITFNPVFLFLIMGIVLMFYFTYSHELVHQEIFRSYGVPNKISFFEEFPYRAVTIGEGNVENCDEYCVLSHNINESIGYQLIPVFLLLFIGLFYIIILLKKIYEELSLMNYLNYEFEYGKRKRD
jgi:hypothetical protein